MKRRKHSAGSWIRKNAEVWNAFGRAARGKRGNLVAATTILNKTARFSSWHLRCVRFNTASSFFCLLSLYPLFLFSFQFVSRVPFLLSLFSIFFLFFIEPRFRRVSFATLIAVDIKQIWDKSIVLWRGIVPTRRTKAERTELFRNFKCTKGEGRGRSLTCVDAR